MGREDRGSYEGLQTKVSFHEGRPPCFLCLRLLILPLSRPRLEFPSPDTNRTGGLEYGFPVDRRGGSWFTREGYIGLRFLSSRWSSPWFWFSSGPFLILSSFLSFFSFFPSLFSPSP